MAESELRFPNLERVLDEYGKAVEDLYKKNLLDNDNVASKGLLESVRYIASFGDRKYEISVSLRDYFRYVEYGTKPHFPPVDKLLEWIRVKPVLPHPDKNGKLPTEKQLAYLIGRKISQVGTKANNIMGKTVEEVNNSFIERIYDAIDRDLDGVATVILNNFTRSW